MACHLVGAKTLLEPILDTISMYSFYHFTGLIPKMWRANEDTLYRLHLKTSSSTRVAVATYEKLHTDYLYKPPKVSFYRLLKTFWFFCIK